MNWPGPAFEKPNEPSFNSLDHQLPTVFGTASFIDYSFGRIRIFPLRINISVHVNCAKKPSGWRRWLPHSASNVCHCVKKRETKQQRNKNGKCQTHIAKINLLRRIVEFQEVFCCCVCCLFSVIFIFIVWRESSFDFETNFSVLLSCRHFIKVKQWKDVQRH